LEDFQHSADKFEYFNSLLKQQTHQDWNNSNYKEVNKTVMYSSLVVKKGSALKQLFPLRRNSCYLNWREVETHLRDK